MSFRDAAPAPGRSPRLGRGLALAAFLAGLSGCSALNPWTKPPEPTSATNGAVVAAVELRGGWFQKLDPLSVLYQRLGADGKPEEALVETNFRSGGSVYLLDALPGTYAPYAVRYRTQNKTREILVGPKGLKDLPLTVKPGEAVFAGRLAFSIRGNRGAKSEFVSADRGKEAEIAALDAAALHLRATLWEELASRRRADLGPSETPVLDKGKEVKPVPGGGGKFTWVDTLRWGPPVAVAGGLEWREPGGRARVAAQFLKPGMDGYRPGDEYLRHLREVGGPEDDHRLVETSFCLRKGYRVRYTTYQYGKGMLVGSAVRVFVTETLLVPEPEGVFLLHYRAQKAHFDRFYPAFSDFLARVILKPMGAGPAPLP